MAEIIKLDRTVEVTGPFLEGYRDGRDNVDRMSLEEAYRRGVDDSQADRPRATGAVETAENFVANAVSIATAEAAYAFGWDIGWQAELQDEYSKGYSVGRLLRICGPELKCA